MSFNDFYAVGVASVQAGSVAVTGTGTAWSSVILPGDTFHAHGLSETIANVGGDGSLTFVSEWSGASLVGSKYYITFDTKSRFEYGYITTSVRELISRFRLFDSASPFYACKGVLINTPPSVPAEGDAYVVGAAPVGVWAGHAGQIAIWGGTDWSFLVPAAGWRAVALSADPPISYVRGASAWVLQSEASNLGDLQDISIGSLTTGDILAYNGTTWANRARHRWFARFANSGGIQYALPNNAYIVPDMAEINPGGRYSTVTGKYTAQVGGDYYIFAKLEHNGAVSTTGYVSLRKNGLFVPGSGVGFPRDPFYATAHMMIIVTLSAGDSIQLFADANANLRSGNTTFGGALIS